jgi:hypothetical protein
MYSGVYNVAYIMRVPGFMLNFGKGWILDMLVII